MVSADAESEVDNTGISNDSGSIIEDGIGQDECEELMHVVPKLMPS